MRIYNRNPKRFKYTIHVALTPEEAETLSKMIRVMFFELEDLIGDARKLSFAERSLKLFGLKLEKSHKVDEKMRRTDEQKIIDASRDLKEAGEILNRLGGGTST